MNEKCHPFGSATSSKKWSQYVSILTTFETSDFPCDNYSDCSVPPSSFCQAARGGMPFRTRPQLSQKLHSRMFTPCRLSKRPGVCFASEELREVAVTLGKFVHSFSQTTPPALPRNGQFSHRIAVKVMTICSFLVSLPTTWAIGCQIKTVSRRGKVRPAGVLPMHKQTVFHSSQPSTLRQEPSLSDSHGGQFLAIESSEVSSVNLWQPLEL